MFTIVGYILLIGAWCVFFRYQGLSAMFSIGAFVIGLALKQQSNIEASDAARFSQVILLAGSASTFVFALLFALQWAMVIHG